jgi:hypothetical protein
MVRCPGRQQPRRCSSRSTQATYFDVQYCTLPSSHTIVRLLVRLLYAITPTREQADACGPLRCCRCVLVTVVRRCASFASSGARSGHMRAKRAARGELAKHFTYTDLYHAYRCGICVCLRVRLELLSSSSELRGLQEATRRDGICSGPDPGALHEWPLLCVRTLVVGSSHEGCPWQCSTFRRVQIAEVYVGWTSGIWMFALRCPTYLAHRAN